MCNFFVFFFLYELTLFKSLFFKLIIFINFFFYVDIKILSLFKIGKENSHYYFISFKVLIKYKFISKIKNKKIQIQSKNKNFFVVV